MNLRQLEYFVAIVEAESFTRAAEALGVAQPALGQQIRKLEEEHDVRLLRRHSRGVEATEAGRLLLDHARRILPQVDAATAALRDFAVRPHGRINLGLTTTMSGILAGPLIRRAAEEMPGIQLCPVEEMSSVLMEWVAEERLQMALAFNVANVAGLRWEPVLQESLFFVESSGKGKADGGTITLAEVAEHPLVVPASPHSIRSLIEERATEAGIRLNVVYEVHAVSMVRDLVGQSMAATVMPYSAVEEGVRAGRLIAKKIVAPEVTRDLFFIHPERRSLSKAELALRAVLLDMLAQEMPQRDWRPIVDRQASIAALERRSRPLGKAWFSA
ncbi:LysR substrate-binding domain-containing protein [Aurantimonas sp. MSK8Z-1]|uniref:LysR substrate-binding domain-containing protein n=1 Tax=Mangrovibrevibacter kandeliae TaxID=2968473 RepID=UPI002117E04B|nr:LysR substrate-binding domain-containing protein [Aurantimonas sp. MSK8Z-1]MCW4115754.1 LysR substrate-binding domain-containing protein [Aurantimonas sp. MSK8Z-1]